MYCLLSNYLSKESFEGFDIAEHIYNWSFALTNSDLLLDDDRSMGRWVSGMCSVRRWVGGRWSVDLIKSLNFL